jgi:hypothetical protein
MRQLLLSLGCAALLIGCQPDGDQIGSSLDKPTFDEYVQSLYQEPGTGLYIVDWDVPVATKEGLRPYYDRLYSDGALTVFTENGKDVLWDDTQKHQLTYCVSKTFAARHADVVAAIAAATGDWSSAADVQFIYKPELDDNCTASTPGVVFDVNPVNDGQFIARAFFPNSPRDQRNVLIDGTAFQMPADTEITLHNILVHELGHSLGLRHEHVHADMMNIPFENWFNCILEPLIDQNFRVVNEYDTASTMHYPQCGGNGNLSMTQLDRDGIAMLYGKPVVP